LIEKQREGASNYKEVSYTSNHICKLGPSLSSNFFGAKMKTKKDNGKKYCPYG